MHAMRFAFASMLLTPVLLLAQAPTTDQILDHYVQAVGGERFAFSVMANAHRIATTAA